MTGDAQQRRAMPPDVGEKRIATIGKVIGDGVVCCLFGTIGWFLWDMSSLQWWGLGVIALLCGACVVATVIRSLRVLWSHGWYEWRLRRHLRTGTAPRSDGLVSSDALKKAGRIK